MFLLFMRCRRSLSQTSRNFFLRTARAAVLDLMPECSTLARRSGALMIQMPSKDATSRRVQSLCILYQAWALMFLIVLTMQQEEILLLRHVAMLLFLEPLVMSLMLLRFLKMIEIRFQVRLILIISTMSLSVLEITTELLHYQKTEYMIAGRL